MTLFFSFCCWKLHQSIILINIEIPTLTTKCVLQLSSDIKNLDPRPEYQRALLSWKEGDHLPSATITGSQISSRLLSVCSAQALVILPPRTEKVTIVTAGTVIDAMLLWLWLFSLKCSIKLIYTAVGFYS